MYDRGLCGVVVWCRLPPLKKQDVAKMNVERPRKIDPSEVWFYHAMDLPGIGPVGMDEGWDLRGRFDEYIGHVPLAGRTVLDVGTASGFLSFEAEQRGASVTSFDAGSIEDRDDRPQDDQRQYVIDELNRMHAGYELAHRAFDSRAKIARGNIYQLSKIVDAHEVVIVGQILVHLKDPLMRCARRRLAARTLLS